MSLLESKRLKLRRFTLSDLPHMIELETDPEIMKFVPSRFPLSLEKIEARLKSWVAKEDLAPYGIWAVEQKDNADFVGWFMLLNIPQKDPELGFMIVRRHWGQGFATEAARVLIESGFNDLNLTSISASTDLDNAMSKKVLAKLGFKFSKRITTPDKVLNRDIELDVFELKKVL